MNISHWFSMGQYGEYVWSAFGITFFIFAMQAWLTVREKKQIKNKLNLQSRFNQP